MSSFTQAILLGSDRLTTPPVPPHATLGEAWNGLDWSEAKETALLEASTLLGTARAAGRVPSTLAAPAAAAPAETRPYPSPRAIAVLRRLLAEEARPLLPEWLRRCAQHRQIVPPFFLRPLFELLKQASEREALAAVIGERGPWLARQNPEWAWVLAASVTREAGDWETGTPAERLAALAHVRATDPAKAREMLASTWADDTGEFRAQALPLLAPGFGPEDEPLATRALTDRRKDVRGAAQTLLARTPTSAFAQRMRTRAEALLETSRGLLGKKLAVTLPTAFDPIWKADGIEEKPPSGIGEKAYWAQQILGLVPLAYWADKFGLAATDLLERAAASKDWADLLLSAWIRATTLHRDAAASAALLGLLRKRGKSLPPGVDAHSALLSLLEACAPADRWRLAAHDAELAWLALPLLEGEPPDDTGLHVLEQIAPAIRDGFNPGGSPTAMLAAQKMPAALRNDAVRLLSRDEGLTKPAEAFLQAFDLRAELHAAFSLSS